MLFRSSISLDVIALGNSLKSNSVGKLCIIKNKNQPCSFCDNAKLLNDKGESTGVYTSEIKEIGRASCRERV